jgi:very-short-patch-repair endonuclease
MVDTEARFSWLVVPKSDELQEPLARIFQSLQAMRGISNFATAARSLQCDFYISNKRLIFEYDERQHFTIQRAKALELYPAELSLGFGRQQWIDACNSIKAIDRSPPYRDEQRAFYDSLRDILAVQNGVRLIRLRHGTYDWTHPNADQHLRLLCLP